MSLLRRIEKSQQPTAGTQGQGTASKMRELRVRRQAATPSRGVYPEIKTRVQNQLIAEIDPQMDMSRIDEVRGTIEDLFDQILLFRLENLRVLMFQFLAILEERPGLQNLEEMLVLRFEEVLEVA